MWNELYICIAMVLYSFLYPNISVKEEWLAPAASASMWEWRIFLASADLDVFSLLNKRNPWFETSRTDVYVSATRDVGVKWRGGGLLEVKLKTDQAADQRSELWSKVCNITVCTDTIQYN